MFPLAFAAVVGVKGVLCVLAMLASILAVGAVLPYSGTGLDAKDNLGGSFGAYVDTALALTEYTASGAITQTQGSVLLHGNSALAMTLAPPTAGTPANGGNDGQKLDIFCDGTGAHTVTTTAANQINGNKHIATFGGAVADKISLIAFNGVWYATGLTGVTLS